MRGVGVWGPAIVAGALHAAGLASEKGAGATGEGESVEVAQARAIGAAADLALRYVQEDGPGSGHVRVELTPEIRSLTVMEARMAAEQAFLGALKERGLGDSLKRITVVVRLTPISDPGSGAAKQVIIYQYKGGRDWSVLSGN